MRVLSLDGPLWRRLARWGAGGPEWFTRVAPSLVGVVVCALSPRRRLAIKRNLRRVRGPLGPIRESVDVASTFVNYAACLTEVLGARTGRGRVPRVSVQGLSHLHDALSDGRGVLFVTAHTGGWQSAGALLSRDLGLSVMIVERAERDADAGAIQDHARGGQGLVVLHVGGDPLSVLPLIRHLREGGVVAVQIDRVPVGVRSREVTMFGERSRVPDGPLRLAALTGAPLLSVFASRHGHRRYEVVVGSPLRMSRSATEADLDAAAQHLADDLCTFARSRPTQWFHFSDE
ncbi:MAG: lysophospholipid acyltransferase family protein [Polyangiaceae bacterium]|jgi:phosphatidylinositol dimannoside acyltransferase